MGSNSSESHVSPKVPFEDAWRFVIRVGVAAEQYGSTAVRLEAFLVALSKSLGFEGVFKSTPSHILFAMREAPELPQRIEIIATPAPGVDLDKLARLGDLLNEVRSGALTIKDASGRLDAIDRAPPPWGKFASLLGYAFTGLGLAPLLGGGWADAILATLLSVLVYGIVLLSARLGTVATEWMPLTTAFVAGFLAMTLKFWIPELNLVLVILSAVAIILPGYTVSLGAGELVARHVVSGMQNLIRGLVCLVKQIAGGWLGVVTAGLVVDVAMAGPAKPVEFLWIQLLFPILLVGLCLSFQVSRRDFLSAFLVSGAAYLGIMAGSAMLDANLGNLLGTIVAVIIANLWARQTGRPTSIVLIPAIVMLVSGTIGFRGLASMAAGDFVMGLEQFARMFLVAMTIVVGIVIGYTLVRPERTL